MKMSKFTAAMLSLMVLGGCVTQQGNKQIAGSLLGAGLGGLAGSNIGGGKGQLAAVAVGTLAGAMIGGGIGESLDRIDQQYASRAQVYAGNAPLGQSVSWNNPDSGHWGTVTPVRDGIDRRTGAYCREYQTTVDIGGRTESAYGTSCRQPDGSWQIVH